MSKTHIVSWLVLCCYRRCLFFCFVCCCFLFFFRFLFLFFRLFVATWFACFYCFVAFSSKCSDIVLVALLCPNSTFQIPKCRVIIVCTPLISVSKLKVQWQTLLSNEYNYMSCCSCRRYHWKCSVLFATRTAAWAGDDYLFCSPYPCTKFCASIIYYCGFSGHLHVPCCRFVVVLVLLRSTSSPD